MNKQTFKKPLLFLVLITSMISITKANDVKNTLPRDISDELVGVQFEYVGVDDRYPQVTDHVSKCITIKVKQSTSSELYNFDTEQREFLINDTGRVFINADGILLQKLSPDQQTAQTNTIMIAVTHKGDESISILAEEIAATPEESRFLDQTITPQNQTATLVLPQKNLMIQCNLVK